MFPFAGDGVVMLFLKLIKKKTHTELSEELGLLDHVLEKCMIPSDF